MLIAHALNVPIALLSPHQFAWPHLLHTKQHALVGNRLSHRIAQGGGDPPVSAAYLVLVIDSADHDLHSVLLVGALGRSALILWRAAC